MERRLGEAIYLDADPRILPPCPPAPRSAAPGSALGPFLWASAPIPTGGMMRLSMGRSFLLSESGGFGSSQKGALRSCPWGDHRPFKGATAARIHDADCHVSA
jgi:hypothetical protein